MSRFLIGGGGGGINLARRPLLPAGNTTTLPIRPSRPLIPLPQFSQIRHKWSWPQWVALHPTTREEVETVFKVCDESRVLGPTATRPITHAGPLPRTKPTLENIRKTFVETPGLQPADWSARGLPFGHVLEIVARLHQAQFFTADAPTRKRKLKPLFEKWDEFWAAARGAKADAEAQAAFDRARERVLKGDPGTIAEARTTKKIASDLKQKAQIKAERAQRFEREQREREARLLLKETRAQERRLLREQRQAARDADLVDGVFSVVRDSAVPRLGHGDGSAGGKAEDNWRKKVAAKKGVAKKGAAKKNAAKQRAAEKLAAKKEAADNGAFRKVLERKAQSGRTHRPRHMRGIRGL